MTSLVLSDDEIALGCPVFTTRVDAIIADNTVLRCWNLLHSPPPGAHLRVLAPLRPFPELCEALR